MNSMRTKALRAACPDRPPTTSPTRDFYEINADSYAESTLSLDMARSVRRFRSLLMADARVLDLGCGGGRDLIALRAAGLRPTGLDISPALARIAHNVSGCPVVVGDLRDPPFDDGSFEAIWASASLLHLRRNELPRTLRRVHGLVRPGGLFFASVKAGMGEERAADGRWFTYFNPEEWRALLSAAGFSVVEVDVEETAAASPVSNGAGRPWLQSFASAV